MMRWRSEWRGVTISPGFSYQHAPQQDVFIQRNASKQLFRNIFKLGRSAAGGSITRVCF